jgi:hypothetical protein
VKWYGKYGRKVGWNCPYLITIHLLFFHIFHIISLFNLLFFHIFHIFSLFSTLFSKSFHYLAYLSSYFLPYFTMFSSYQKQALPAMISPLCTNGHDIKQYGRTASWNVKWYGKYGRNISWIVKWFRKYSRKLWNDTENMEEK